jgi:hypothetical protein
MNTQLFKETIQKYSHDSDYQKEWYIICSQNTKTHHHCICGHNVKRITYIYNKMTKHIMVVGTTCIKKCGIKQHLKNGILVLTIKNILESNTYITSSDNIVVIPNVHSILNDSIQTQFSKFQEKITFCISNNIDIDYYDIIAPFRRLLNDVCYLVTEYNYDFMILLKEIEMNVNAMNTTVKHIIIDETKEDMSEESLSESSEDTIHIVETYIDDENPIYIVEKYMEDEEPIIGEQLHINDESVNIELDNIYFTITEEQCDIFVCTYCDTSFFTQNDYYNHEKTCVDNHSIIDSEQNTDELKSESLSEIEGSVDELLYDNNELIIYEPQSVLDKYCNLTTVDLKCEFCIRSIPSYCNCDMRFRLYNLALGIYELKKDVSELSVKISKLLEETQALRLKYCCYGYGTYYIRGSIYHTFYYGK